MLGLDAAFLLVEAKRINPRFRLDVPSRARKLRLDGLHLLGQKKVKPLVEQVQAYASSLGAQFAILTNGSQVVIFKPYLPGRFTSHNHCRRRRGSSKEPGPGRVWAFGQNQRRPSAQRTQTDRPADAGAGSARAAQAPLSHHHKFPPRSADQSQPAGAALFCDTAQYRVGHRYDLSLDPARLAGQSRIGGAVLLSLSKRDPNRAAKIAASALTGNFFVSQEAEKVLIRMAAVAPKGVMLALGETMLDEKLGLHFFLGVHRGLIAALPIEVVEDWLENAGVEGARRVARHLPEPFIGSDDVPTVPALTEFVFTKFEEDDRTFQEFYAGMHTHKSYAGDIASQVENEGLVAKRFLNSHIRRIKEWARLEVQGSAKEAEMWRRLEEEKNQVTQSRGPAPREVDHHPRRCQYDTSVLGVYHRFGFNF